MPHSLWVIFYDSYTMSHDGRRDSGRDDDYLSTFIEEHSTYETYKNKLFL